VIDEFRTDVTKTRKDGSRGKLRIDYGDPREPDAAVKWIWRYLDGAKTGADLFRGSEAGTDRSLLAA
jgi:hypothetical protein